MTSTSSSPTTPTQESVSSARRSNDLQNVLIIGATGIIGTYITEAIVTHKSEFGRVAVLTSKKTLVEKVREICALESWGVEVFVGDLDDEKNVKEAYRGMIARHLCTSPCVHDKFRHEIPSQDRLVLYPYYHSPNATTRAPER